MDVVLKGILQAVKLSDSLKRQLIKEKLLPMASQPVDDESCNRLLVLSWDLAVSSEKLLDKEAGLKVFHALVVNNKGTLATWASPERIQGLLSRKDNNTDKASLFQLLMFLLDNMEATSATYASSLTAMCLHLGPALQAPLSLDSILAASRLLQRFPREAAQQHSLDILRALAHVVIRAPVQEVARQKADLVCLSLKGILTQDKKFTLVVIDLLHELLSSRDIPSSLILAPVVEALSLDDTEIERHCQRTVSMITDDQVLQLVLQRLLTWMSWPETKCCRTWILCFLMACNKSQRRTSVESTLASSLYEVLHALIYPNTRAASFMVFQYVVLMYHQCPEIMQKVLDLTPGVISKVQESADFCASLKNLLTKAKSQLDFGLNLTSGDRTQQGECSSRVGSAVSSPTEDAKPPSYLGAGLENLGNTCYINSVVQALNMTYRFRHLVLQWSQDCPQSVICELQEVLAFLLLTKRPAYCPRKFIEVARPNWFTPGEQQDSQEFLNHLFDLLEEEQKASDAASLFVREVFGGTTETCITCSLCEKTSITSDLFYSLLLPLSGIEPPASNASDGGSPTSAIALEDVLTSYLKPEQLEGRNKYRCDNCDRLEDAKRRIRITTAPKHLILTLLRFQYESNRRKKISVPVCLPRVLHLPVETIDGPSTATYFLYAAILHSGSSAEKGHYYTYARCSASQAASRVEDCWGLFNDRRVSRASFQSLCDISQRSCRDTVYMLFYCQTPEETISTNPLALISQKLRDQVLIDNYKYMKEEELKANSKSQVPQVQNPHHRRDSDEDQPPPGPGSCGLGGGFGSFDAPSHFVF